MTKPHPNDDLWNEAMALLLRWQADPADAQVRDDILEFCGRSAEHRAAWDSAKRLYRLTGEATGADAHATKRKGRKDLTRRSVLVGMGAVVAGAGVLKGPDVWRSWRADMMTGIGTIDQRALPDGSRVTLGPDSAIQIDYSPASRTVALLDGMALFEVAPEGNRPFRARTGDLIATAADGMSFEVRQNARRSLVAVDAGRVQVAGNGTEAVTDVLAAGDWFARGPGRNDSQKGHRDAGEIAAWRQHALIADQERIDAVVAEIARWQSARVIIAQSSLAAARVSGLFDLRDPFAALQAVVGPYGAHVRQITPWLTVLSTI